MLLLVFVDIHGICNVVIRVLALGWEFLRELHNRDWGRTMVIYDHVLGILVSDPMALCIVWKCNGLGLETVLLHDGFVGR